ncbi:MAG: hypothetical protein EZS28_034312 [Streblomastix strix]|uniref:Uncharacterized protein n=1 Tax=Streblomastix strix TaxID=222440 RepID=A0A5J4UJB2_9EUKA|nr:MAG: hypothetical protein EZS28_034312 [Streblomastix strix]
MLIVVLVVIHLSYSQLFSARIVESDQRSTQRAVIKAFVPHHDNTYFDEIILKKQYNKILDDTGASWEPQGNINITMKHYSSWATFALANGRMAYNSREKILSLTESSCQADGQCCPKQGISRYLEQDLDNSYKVFDIESGRFEEEMQISIQIDDDSNVLFEKEIIITSNGQLHQIDEEIDIQMFSLPHLPPLWPNSLEAETLRQMRKQQMQPAQSPIAELDGYCLIFKTNDPDFVPHTGSELRQMQLIKKEVFAGWSKDKALQSVWLRNRHLMEMDSLINSQTFRTEISSFTNNEQFNISDNAMKQSVISRATCAQQRNRIGISKECYLSLISCEQEENEIIKTTVQNPLDQFAIAKTSLGEFFDNFQFEFNEEENINLHSFLLNVSGGLGGGIWITANPEKLYLKIQSPEPKIVGAGVISTNNYKSRLEETKEEVQQERDIIDEEGLRRVLNAYVIVQNKGLNEGEVDVNNSKEFHFGLVQTRQFHCMIEVLCE